MTSLIVQMVEHNAAITQTISRNTPNAEHTVTDSKANKADKTRSLLNVHRTQTHVHRSTSAPAIVGSRRHLYEQLPSGERALRNVPPKQTSSALFRAAGEMLENWMRGRLDITNRQHMQLNNISGGPSLCKSDPRREERLGEVLKSGGKLNTYYQETSKEFPWNCLLDHLIVHQNK